MVKPTSWIARAAVFLFLTTSVSSDHSWGQPPEASGTTPELYFYTRPSKQLFSRGESVVIGLELYSRSEQPLLISRVYGDEFVSFKVTGPGGNEIAWQGEARVGSREYSPSDFTVLGQYKQITANRIISLKDGTGFAFDRPGQYKLTAEFSMGPPNNFAAFEAQAKAPAGSFRSEVKFCIEACILEPFRVRDRAPRSALDAVRRFYTVITRYQQSGIPHGHARKLLEPLLSKRLADELNSLQSCDNDYYLRYGETLRAHTIKPATPWLEDGLFTGPNDAATPRRFSILDSRSIGDSRVDVHLRFPEPENCCSQHPPYYYTEGVVTVILEDSHWVVDDYVAMYENDDLERLSAGYPAECKGGQWVGEQVY